MYNKNEIKWHTELEIVDEETGEILPRFIVEQGKYYIHKKEVKNEIRENNGRKQGARKILWICRKNNQGQLF